MGKKRDLQRFIDELRDVSTSGALKELTASIAIATWPRSWLAASSET